MHAALSTAWLKHQQALVTHTRTYTRHTHTRTHTVLTWELEKGMKMSKVWVGPSRAITPLHSIMGAGSVVSATS